MSKIHIVVNFKYVAGCDYRVSRTSEEARLISRTANAFFFAAFGRITGNLKGLSVGDDRCDYLIPIARSRLHGVTQELARLEREVEDTFGLRISVMPISMPDTEF